MTIRTMIAAGMFAIPPSAPGMGGPVKAVQAAEFENIVEVAGPADRDGNAGHAILQMVPAGEPG